MEERMLRCIKSSAGFREGKSYLPINNFWYSRFVTLMNEKGEIVTVKKGLFGEKKPNNNKK